MLKLSWSMRRVDLEQLELFIHRKLNELSNSLFVSSLKLKPKLELKLFDFFFLYY